MNEMRDNKKTNILLLGIIGSIGAFTILNQYGLQYLF